MKAWHAVRTKSLFRAAAHLREQGFLVYRPTRWTAERIGRRLRPVGEPRFENYLFVMLDPGLGEHVAAGNTPGVAEILGGPAGPAAMEFELVQDLMVAEDAELDTIRQRRHEDSNGLRLGQTVRILRGAADGAIGMHGQIASMKRGKLTVFVGSWAVRCNEADVLPVESEAGK